MSFAPLRRAPHWFDYWAAKGTPARGRGRLLVHPPAGAPGIPSRDLLVYLPRSYGESRRRFPLVVLQDGQNLFDPDTSFAGSWHAAEALDALADEGIEAIALGVPNAESHRLAEYSPWRDARFGGGGGRAFVDFLADRALPLVAASFRVEEDPEATTILGASMGALVSLYAYFIRPDRFGRAGGMSPSLFIADGAMTKLAERSRRTLGRIYLDVGTLEGRRRFRARKRAGKSPSAAMRRLRKLAGILERKGYERERSLLVIEETGGTHDESAWGRRLPVALRFLLGERTDGEGVEG